MASFKGRYSSTIDSKRRLKLPKKLREAVLPSSNDNFVIGPGYDGCIFLYPTDEWAKQEEKLRNLKVDLAEHRFLERVFVPESEDARIDRVGRLTISQRLLDFAQIKKDILILGILSRIELWAPQVYQKYREQYKQSYEEAAEKIFGS
ncbi:MAG: division/cell wall cluster transcriptional repressor MraZ [candidate division Zixibacteria bacterium]|nr:division/cell wall cluster transcriptional repressor MraZ [candidate division Zixibacteria bacterium]